jgi:hypothetical protein
MNLLSSIKSAFQPPAAEVLAAQEYDEARRALLAAQTAMEYAESMVEYHRKRIERLKETLAGES